MDMFGSPEVDVFRSRKVGMCRSREVKKEILRVAGARLCSSSKERRRYWKFQNEMGEEM